MDDLAEGDQFVLLRRDHYTRFSNPLASLGDTLFYKAANAIVPLGNAATAAVAATGVAETPYAARNLAASFAGTDVLFDWDYRSRLAAGLNPTNHGEAALAFQIDIMDGADVIRTIAVTTNQATWTAAQQATDFGALPSSFTWSVFMMSALGILVPGHIPAVAGRGYHAEQISTVVDGAMLTEGDEQSGTDRILLGGDEQSGTDAEAFREIING
jgi:hypothetical protein